MDAFNQGLLEALTAEYVRDVRCGVGHFLKQHRLDRRTGEIVDKFERQVRKARKQRGADGAAAAVAEVRQQLSTMDLAAQAAGARNRSRSRSSSGSGSGSGDSSGSENIRSGLSSEQVHASIDRLFGGCLLTRPCQEAPADCSSLRGCPGIVATQDHPRFPKMVRTCGVTYIGAENASDEFLLAIAGITAEIFAPDPQIDIARQERVMAECHKYKACCPVSKGCDRSSVRPSKVTLSTHSVCDRIGQGVERQAMEVMEHVLHHITDVGLHYAFPEDWGMRSGTRLHAAMQEAIRLGLYDVTDYRRFAPPEARLRVEMQEYAYWLITTGWDLQEEFGPKAEWHVRTRAELYERLPIGSALFLETIVPTLMPPRRESLRALAVFEPQDA